MSKQITPYKQHLNPHEYSSMMKSISILIGFSTLTTLFSLLMLFTATGTNIAYIITLFGLLVLLFGYGLYFQSNRGDEETEEPFDVAVRIYITFVTMFIGFLLIVMIHESSLTYAISASELVLFFSLLVLLQKWPSKNNKVRFTNGQITNIHSIYSSAIIMGALFVLIGMFSGNISPRTTITWIQTKLDAGVLFSLLISISVVLSLLIGILLRDNLIIEQPEKIEF